MNNCTKSQHQAIVNQTEHIVKPHMFNPSSVTLKAAYEQFLTNAIKVSISGKQALRRANCH
ncbi:hypothetical protein I2483_01100 [Sporosarcina sp. E16_3]|uniref:hypothetical protein n=1 Tax=Sporosarcina sp. E16_3 TaxID=2789293 RepID=UPI001A922531|nr:hypothetical protein [Sporosarcina sp. E16_3]MBO0600245.1 hypothetical protein [Sporosarcina sp. E16_3]